MNVAVGDTSLRISCDAGRAAAAIRDSLSSLVVEEPAPLGFVLTSPAGRNRIFVLTDRGGFILARSRSLDEIIVVLSSLLGSFLPPPEGNHRLRMRILASGGSAYLCVPPVLYSEPPIERHLHRRGLSVVDRLTVDLDTEAMVVDNQSATWFDAGESSAGVGHTPAGLRGPLEIAGVLLPSVSGVADASRANTIAAIAERSVEGTLSDRLLLARKLEARGVHFVQLFAGGLVQALDHLVNAGNS